ncbi:MAG: AAA family ATPase [Candidatus Electrothrix aestuarii]|uniref:AAA family ATPase n=1 Tax=Candidatus Electrothrix aestuarii TaxID=3062594 RepID=A0AAU8LSZ5_9BACT|nr:hypothetical protein [Candidatus Electrothrix aestuarii]
MQYIKECLQLLYWIYFKPYTLKQHVQAICPEIANPYEDSIYERSAKANTNLQLQRYDEQCWWLTVLVPIAAVFSYASLVEGIARLRSESIVFEFDWGVTSLFMLAWLVGHLVFLGIRIIGRLSEFFIFMVVAVAGELLIVTLLDITTKGLLSKEEVAMIGGMAFGVFGILLGGAGGVALEVAGGIASGIALGIELDMARGVMLFSLIFGVGLAVMLSMAISVDESVAVGVVLAMAVGFVGSLAYDALYGVVFFSCVMFSFLRIFFWLPELTWMLLLKLSPIPVIRCLPCLPPRFDQLIYLPIPFLPGFVAEAYQENQAAARQTIDYLITSTNQQKAARRAMSLISAEECKCCRTARDIAEIREQLSWLSEEPSPGLAACLNISQDVTAALEASTLYRQAQQLDKVLQRIDRQRTSLASASAREATSFGAVLDNWQGILQAARKTLREQAAQSDEIPQVYLAGPALDPNKAGPLFKGRRDLFRQIETLTLSAQHPTLVMHGGRRSGKTSTLNYLPKWLPSDILPLLIDGQSLAATSTLSGFAEEFADLITKSARKVHSLKLPALASVTTSDDPFVTLRRWLDAVEQAVPDKTLLLCLDEFERLDEIVRSTDSRAPLNFLRHLIQHRDSWTLLFTGVLTPEELPAYWSDYLINCETLRVSYLAEDDCLELIQHPVEDFPDIYPTPVAHAIRDLTGGQPYFTQLLCHELVEQLNRKKAKTVQMDDLQTVLPAVFERGYQVFREFWQSLTDPQRALLLAVAEAKTPSEEAMRAAPVLVRKEILAQQNGGWYFRVPLIYRWLLEEQGGLS